MLQFDPKQPFAEIWGQPGIAFQQNGKTFNGRGELVSSQDIASLKPVDSPMPAPTPDDGSVPKCYLQEDNSKDSAKEELENLSWHKLKGMLAIYGEVYENREKAIAFLKGIK